MRLSLPGERSRWNFLERCVLSASGLRFIHSGDEEDPSSQTCEEASLFVLCALEAYLEVGNLRDGSTLWIGRDARPTGPYLMEIAASYLEARGFLVKTMGLGPIPEIMAATHQNGDDGFVYFTASHNPKGHNGLKLGLADGAVLGKALATPLIERLKELYLDDGSAMEMVNSFSLGESLTRTERDKQYSLSAYSNFSLATIFPEAKETFLDQVSASWKGGEKPLFLVDMNGSSRLASVDLDFLQRAGLEVELMGGEAGVFHHAIIPEGASLEPLRQRMQEHLDAGRRVLGGLVPDCDGDRGNLILPMDGRAVALKAQETFALCVLAVFGSLRAQGNDSPLALAVNGPTSLRIDRMLSSLSVKVHRAEVGEANVLTLANDLRSKGYSVPLAGEGSNGGNILYPSTVRDPLMTLLSLLKYISLPLEKGLTGAEVQIGSNLDPCQALEKVFHTLNPWHTTDAFEGEALLPVPAMDHETLKTGYEGLILEHFKTQNEFWERKGVGELSLVSNEGVKNIPGPGNRPKGSKGGLQVFLKDRAGIEKGFLWMRGSGTEPVFRVMVDWGGEESEYRELLDLHRSLIEKVLS